MMMKNLASAATIVLFSGVSAIAQSTTDTTATLSASGVAGWDQTTRDSFFSDDTTLRSDAEVRSGWDSLDSAQQARVRADCETLQGDGSAAATTQGSAGADTAADTSTATDGSSSSDSSTTATAGTDTTAGADASTTDMMPDMASMRQLCDQIKTY
ncbi:hypothetical protein PZ897_14510 [Hoeflea sp. YIM 152468]|uniref:hypothetical protein n=1 Tax=Hoeflea sp. YIM 152468 TaxID=3031759 RepID=UPI0023DCD409|nr:hypothetical protein [Hoeflea sp. YIM 152468]MDF1609394.1 hypothetical protein [Hoeflea sp. YIM 152468]